LFLATHESAVKRARQSIKKHKRNSPYRSLLKSVTKKVSAETSKKSAQESLKSAVRTISKIASKGIIHKRAAARKISGLAKKVNQLSAV
jgi:small subunit ribosomal protein S20